jgi:hypothetical protein
MAAAGGYASALGNLRDSVKWIIGAFATGSAIMFSGLTVNSISTLADSGQWQLPVGLAAVPVVAAIAAVIAALRVISVTPQSPGTLFPKYWAEVGGTAPRAVNKYWANTSGTGPRPTVDLGRLADELPNVLGAYRTREAFDERLVDALDEKKTAFDRLNGTSERQADFDGTAARLDDLQSTLKDALDCEAYLEGRRRYRVTGWIILAALLVAVGSAVASGIVTGDKERSAPPQAASFSAPVPVAVWFSGRPPQAADGPRGCPVWSGMPAYVVGGTESRPLVLFPGYAASDARSHGIQASVAQCARPWLWPAGTGQVLVVPR